MAETDTVRISVPRLVQDRLYLFRSNAPDSYSDVLLARPTGHTTIEDKGPFLDGPVSPRIAVVDIDADTGGLRPASTFKPATGRFDGRYLLDEALMDPDVEPLALEDPQFVQQSVFATAYHTLQFFEDLMGRRIDWAFPGQQLLIVPRAGRMENAFYERESRSLQFFEFEIVASSKRERAQRRLVYTALSHDIVAHETAHAILDGIAPDLYDAILPESLALHEAIADLAAIFLTLQNEMVLWSVLNISSSTLDTLEVVARIAEEFGHDIRLGENAEFLRSADNDYILDSAADGSGGKLIDRHSPHDCSQVLTGAVFGVFRRHVEALSGDMEKKIHRASRDITRVLVPALDLLPPGDAGFADFAQAVVAQAQISGRGAKIARWLCDELHSRGVGARYEKITAPPGLQPISGFDQSEIIRYAEGSRTLLGVPDDARLSSTLVQRERVQGGRRNSGSESILRIGWDQQEKHAVGKELSGAWSIRTGLTLVFSTGDGRPLAVIKPSTADNPGEQRSRQLQRWMADGLLTYGTRDAGGGAIAISKNNGFLTATATARTLHIVG
jgi:hypothetical protein